MGPVRRSASRVLLVDDSDRLLLFTAGEGADRWWFTTGGGIDEGETAEQAAVREVREETGLELDPAMLGPVVHRRRVQFPWAGRLLDQDEQFRVARVPAYDVDTAGHDTAERALVLGHRWWSLADLRATDERVAPPELADLLAHALDVPA